MSDYADDVYTKRLTFPEKQVLSALDYSIDLADPTFPVLTPGDAIATLTVMTQPSGTGELVATRCYAIDSVVTAWLTAGVPGRGDYLVRFLIGTQQGRTIDLIATLPMSGLLALQPPPAAPSQNWSAPVYWQANRLAFNSAPNGVYYPVIL